MRSTSTYASDFWQLVCDMNWREDALMSQFHRGLRNDIKDLLLSISDPQTFDEAISQAVKCNNHLFQQWQEKCSSIMPHVYTNYCAASSPFNSNRHLKTKDMLIDVVCFKPLFEQKRSIKGNLVYAYIVENLTTRLIIV